MRLNCKESRFFRPVRPLFRSAFAVPVVAVLLVVMAAWSRPWNAVEPEKGLEGDDVALLSRENAAVEKIARNVTPAIVNIQTTQVVRLQQSPYYQDPFFRQFFGGPFNIPREQREHALGSGVIVAPDGLIVTNSHVAARATDVRVMLADKRVFKGKVVGTDPDTDVAVIRIEAKGLPTVPWGDSSALRVGHMVLAFGNPFGLNQTVTRGIVSAIGRAGLGIESFEDFIQTDAAINPGNSGGALVDVHGRLVGINTAIVSNTSGMGGEGGSVGIGFAIPSNIVRHVVESLLRTGKVERGYLGVSVGDLEEGLARKFGVPDTAGAVVEDVTPGSPAAKAGLKAGDVIRTVDEKAIGSKDQLTFAVATDDPGTVVQLGILRDGRPQTVSVTLGSRPANLGVAEGTAKAPVGSTLRGITVQSLDPKLREHFGLGRETSGVVISRLDPASPAAQGGLAPGDVIQEIDRHPVRTVADFERLAAATTGEVLLRIVRQGAGLFIVISPAE